MPIGPSPAPTASLDPNVGDAHLRQVALELAVQTADYAKGVVASNVVNAAKIYYQFLTE